MIVLPPGLTEDEEALQKKFAKLKKKKKALMALKKQQGSTSQAIQGGIKRSISDQPVVDTATATEQAKMLVKTGAISAIKVENKNSGFKRSWTRKVKPKETKKGSAPTYQPFQRSVSADDDSREARRPQRKYLYESFVSSSDSQRDPEKESEECRDPDKESDQSESLHGFERDSDRDRSRERSRDRHRDRDRDRHRDRDRDRDRGHKRERDRDVYRRSDSYPEGRVPRKGNTVYVNGENMNEAMLTTAFSAFGKIIDLSVDSVHSCAFVTYDKIESADQAVAQLNNTVVEDVELTVSIAHKQPMLDVAVGKSVWATLAVVNTINGSHRDQRDQVIYQEDNF